jgi:hypothetical protein
MADGFYRLTYRDIAERLGISPDAARMKANRKAKAGAWRLLPDEAPGGERLVEIPSAELDGMLAKAAAAAERSASTEPAEQSAPAQPAATAEHPVEASPADERSPVVELYVPPKVSVSFEPQHPHMPPATAEHPTSAEQAATPEHPAQAEQAVSPEQPVQAEQPALAEAVANDDAADVQDEPRSGEDGLDPVANAGMESGDALVTALTARVATLTNRLIEETTAREKASEELSASAVRESELKVEIERLSARVAELTAAAEGDHRPWWRKMIQGRLTD